MSVEELKENIKKLSPKKRYYGTCVSNKCDLSDVHAGTQHCKYFSAGQCTNTDKISMIELISKADVLAEIDKWIQRGTITYKPKQGHWDPLEYFERKMKKEEKHG
jgi:hypothetical protein